MIWVVSVCDCQDPYNEEEFDHVTNQYPSVERHINDNTVSAICFQQEFEDDATEENNNP